MVNGIYRNISELRLLPYFIHLEEEKKKPWIFITPFPFFSLIFPSFLNSMHFNTLNSKIKL